MKIRIAVVLAATLFARLAHGSGAGHMVYGVGTQGCDDWTAARKLPGQTQLFESWLSGYVSGANDAGPGLVPLDVREMVVYVDQYCRAHSLDMIYEAAGQLIDGLRAAPAPVIDSAE